MERPELKGLKHKYPKRRKKRVLFTRKQQNFVEGVKRRMKPGKMPTVDDAIDAAMESYECVSRRSASSVARENLKKAHIIAELGLNPEGRKIFFSTVYAALLGEDKHHPKDKELKQTSMRILARSFVPTEEHHVVEDERFRDKTTDEIEYYARHGEFPERKNSSILPPAGNA